VVSALLYRLGRLLQVVGMILLPLAIAGNLAPGTPLDLRQSLTLSGVGVVVFGVGWLLQQAGRPH
jgi:drug/metabolite transporter (DMT)-like permease